MKFCRICGMSGRALCYPCQGKISAASPKSKERRNSPEGKTNLLVAQKKAHETWNGSPENLTHLARLHNSPKHKAQIKRLNNSPEHKAQLARLLSSPEHKAHLARLNGSPEGKAQLAAATRKAQETWVGSPEHKAQLTRLHNSPENKAALAAGRKKAAAKPTWPEAKFYGLIFGWLNGNIKDFRFQEVIPTEHCAHRVDARRGNVIFELDGGGHHVFKDRHEHDWLEDEDYAGMGYRVVRATNETDLFLRVLQVVER